MKQFFNGFTVFHACGLFLMFGGHYLPGGQPTEFGGKDIFGSGFNFGFTVSFVQVVGAVSFSYELIKAKIKGAR